MTPGAGPILALGFYLNEESIDARTIARTDDKRRTMPS
jgi:hypothetical protein